VPTFSRVLTRWRKGLFATILTALLIAGTVAYPAKTAKAEEFLINAWDQEKGLPSTRIDEIARTADGYVWLATYGGLVRFDGLRFTTFTSNSIPALKVNTINCVFVDHKNVLWIGTTAGTLVKMTEAGFAGVELPSSAYDGKRINTITEDSEGTIWLAFDDGAGILNLTSNVFKIYNATNGLPPGNVTQLLCDHNKRLWGVAANQLITFNHGQWQTPQTTNEPPEPIRVISEASNGGIWVATLGPGSRGGTRIYNLKDGNWSRDISPYPWPQNSARSRAQALFEDAQGRLWCATAGSGIFLRPRNEGWQRLVSVGNLSQSDALCFREDENGIVWIGTRTAGLHQVRPRPVKTLQLPPEANLKVVLTVCAAQDGSVWAGTEGAGIFRWQGNVMTHYSMEGGDTNSTVNVMFEDSQTNLWAGTAGGLFRLQGQKFTPAEGSPAMQTPVMSLFEDRRGAVWVGTRGGLLRFFNGEIRLFTSHDGLGGAPVRALTEDNEGHIWVAIETAGVFRQNGEHFEQISNLPPALANGTRAMHCDSEGAIWFATRVSGLFRLKNSLLDGWDNLSDGLPSDRFFALLEDDKKNLWISSESGIFGCRRSMLNSYRRGHSISLSPWRLTQADGLAYNVCTGGGQPAASRSSDGRLWFGDGPTVAAFDPDTVPRSTRVRTPIVEEIMVDGQPVMPGHDGVRVRSGANSFEFHYTAPNILAPQSIKFRYRLDGVDKQWVDADTRRTVTYTHLSPGHYIFNVQAAALDGEWSKDDKAFMALIVIPRLYERPTVQIAAGLVLLAAVAFGVWRAERSRSRMRLERLRLQTAMEQERQRIARDIHDDLGAGLTEIILLSDNLHDELPPVPGSEKMVNEISTRARALTRAMDEVVWAVNPRNDTLEGLLTYFNKFAQEYLTRAGIRCRMDVPVELPFITLAAETRHHLYLTCKEALNNCVKHSRASEVWIHLKPADRHYVLSIEDNGKGFDVNLVARGNGLQNMRRRLEEVGGHCHIQSKPGSGTRVDLFIRVAQEVAGNANQNGKHRA